MRKSIALVTLLCVMPHWAAASDQFTFKGKCTSDSEVAKAPYQCSGGFIAIDQSAGRMAIGLSNIDPDKRHILMFSGKSVGSGYQFSIDRATFDNSEIPSPTGFCVVRNISPELMFECTADVSGPYAYVGFTGSLFGELPPR